MTPAMALQGWLDQRLDPAASGWLHECAASLAAGGSDRELFRAVSLVTRKLGKAPLAHDAAALVLAEESRPGWDPSRWSIDQAARVRLLLAAAGDGDVFARRLDQLCVTADVGRTGRVLPRSAALSRTGAAPRCVRAKVCATNMSSGVRGRGAPQPLSRRALAGRGLEPDGAQGAVRGQCARSDRRPRPTRQSHSGAHARRLCARALGCRPAGEPGALALHRAVRVGRLAGRSRARAGHGHGARTRGRRARLAQLPRSRSATPARPSCRVA